MTDSDNPTVSSSEVFSALASETRVEILEAIWSANERGLTFSQLKDIIDMEDSGQFNYHLSQLRDKFVKVEDGKYRVTVAGRRVAGAILSGMYTQAGDEKAVELENPCAFCGGVQIFRYADETLLVDCSDCGRVLTQFPIPPSVFADQSPEQLPETAQHYLRMKLRQASEGFCINCEGPITTSLGRGSDFAPVKDDRLTTIPVVGFQCRRCGEFLSSDIRTILIDHPAVVSFFYDHGIDIRDIPSWDLFAPREEMSRIIDENPFRAEVEFTAAGEAIRLIVNDNFVVEEILDD